MSGGEATTSIVDSVVDIFVFSVDLDDIKGWTEAQLLLLLTSVRVNYVN